MKDQFYTVPEGFLDKVAAKAAADAKRIRHRRLAAAGLLSTACVALMLVLLPMGKKLQDNSFDLLSDAELAALVDVYELDVFLNDNY